MHPTKIELRRSLKKARLGLSPDERQAKSTAISRHLWQAIDWSALKSVHCFEPIERFGEVNITDFITALRQKHPKIQLFTSRRLDDSWKVFSLDDTQSSTPLQFDVIIVPMLGFDPATLQRIGYGGGYYDRFLAAQPDVQKIGVCFELGKLQDVPAESHDIPLDVIITEVQPYS